MQNISIPTLYAVRYYCMKCNNKKKSLSCIWTDILIVLMLSSRRFLKAKDPLASPLVTFSVIFLQRLLFWCDWCVVFLTPVSLFRGLKAVFGLSTAAYMWCSEAEVIMWVTSQLRLMVRESCLPLLWQTVDQIPKQLWSSWDECSGHLRNSCAVMPCVS